MARAKRLGRILARPKKCKEKLTSRQVHTLEVREMAVKKVLTFTTAKNEDFPPKKEILKEVFFIFQSISVRDLSEDGLTDLLSFPHLKTPPK